MAWAAWGGCILVSIHAPARGATQLLPTFTAPGMSFNPRPREGGDRYAAAARRQRRRFNPRPREGGDSREHYT